MWGDQANDGSIFKVIYICTSRHSFVLSGLDLSQPSPGVTVVEEAVCHPEIIWNVPGWARQIQKTLTDALTASYFSLVIGHKLRQRQTPGDQSLEYFKGASMKHWKVSVAMTYLISWTFF